METKGEWLFGSGIHGNIRQSQVAKPQFVMVDEEILHKKDVSILLFRIDLKDREMNSFAFPMNGNRDILS